MSAGDELATEYADTMVDSIGGIMARYDGTGHDEDCELHDSGDCPSPGCAADDVDVCECQERAREELDETYALELVAEVGEPFSVLLTYGGPTAWVEWTARLGTSSATLKVTWSSDVVLRRSAAIRALADYYACVMESIGVES